MIRELSYNYYIPLKQVNDLNLIIGGNTLNNDGYSSTILKATVQYSSNKVKPTSIDLILKLITPKRDGVIEKSTFETEIRMYSATLGEMQRLFETSGSDVQFAPKYILISFFIYIYYFNC